MKTGKADDDNDGDDDDDDGPSVITDFQWALRLHYTYIAIKTK